METHSERLRDQVLKILRTVDGLRSPQFPVERDRPELHWALCDVFQDGLQELQGHIRRQFCVYDLSGVPGDVDYDADGGIAGPPEGVEKSLIEG